jgi:hypothetical protein
MKFLFTFLIFIILILTDPIAYGKTMSADDYLNITLIDSAKDIPVTLGYPNAVIKHQSGSITGWIDIVGWKEMIRENGIDYVPTNPADMAIIQYDVKATKVPGSVSKIDKFITSYQINNLTVVDLKVDLYWKSISCDDKNCWEVPHIDKSQFSDIKVSPVQYKPMNKEFKINIIQYNNSIAPKSVISVNSPDASKISVSYHGNTLIHYIKLIALNYTDNEIAFGDVSSISTWNNEGNLISHIGEDFVINSPNVNYSDVIIKVSTPYENVTILATNTNISVEEIKMSPNTVFNPVIWPFLAILVVSYLVTRKILKVILLR